LELREQDFINAEKPLRVARQNVKKLVLPRNRFAIKQGLSRFGQTIGPLRLA
jgi:hypothetical protein